MKIELFESHKRDYTVDFNCTPDEIGVESIEGYTFDNPIRVFCSVHTSDDLAVLKVKVKTEVIVECARCLETFDEAVSGEFSLVVRKLRKGEILRSPSDESEESDENDILVIDNDTNEVEIGEYIHDALLLELPLKPVCREDCLGLCSVCGANLNEGDCGCKKGPSDGRWNVLSELLDKKEE